MGEEEPWTASAEEDELAAAEGIDEAEATGLPLLEQVARLLEGEGLPLPPMPEALAHDLVILQPWLFGSRDDAPGPQNLAWFVEEAARGDGPAYVLLGLDGLGAASHALHYYLVCGPAALFVQRAWDGVYASRDGARAALRRDFAEAEHLLETAAGAARAGGIGPDERVVAVVSDHAGGGWAWLRFGTPPSWQAAGEPLAAAAAALRQPSPSAGEDSAGPEEVSIPAGLLGLGVRA